MRLSTTRFSRRRMLAVAAASLAAAGCSEELGAERGRTTRVAGRVILRGRPVDGGWVEFRPIGATVGNLRTAVLRQDGTYEADGVPVGTVAVYLFLPRMRRRARQAGDAELLSLLAYAEQGGRAGFIRRTVPAAHPARLDIDLDVEQVLLQQRMRAREPR